MHKLLIGGIAGAAILAAALGGYRLGAGAWPDPATWVAKTTQRAPNAKDPVAAASTERKVLYWRDPDGKNDFAPGPKKTSDGRDYIPVYDDEEGDFAEAKREGPERSAARGPRKILYYR